MSRTIGALLIALTMLVLAGSSAGADSNPFPDCSPKAVPGTVNLVLKGPCQVVPGQSTRYVLVLTNNTKRVVTTAQMVFARKSFLVKSSVPYKDQNKLNPDSRVEWDYANVKPDASKSVVLWMKFKKLSGQELTSYILWLRAKPAGQRAIFRNWYPKLFFVPSE